MSYTKLQLESMSIKDVKLEFHRAAHVSTEEFDLDYIKLICQHLLEVDKSEELKSNINYFINGLL